MCFSLEPHPLSWNTKYADHDPMMYASSSHAVAALWPHRYKHANAIALKVGIVPSLVVQATSSEKFIRIVETHVLRETWLESLTN